MWSIHGAVGFLHIDTFFLNHFISILWSTRRKEVSLQSKRLKGPFFPF